MIGDDYFNLHSFFEENYKLLTVTGVFGGISLYLTRVSGANNGSINIFVSIAVLSTLLLFLYCSVVVLHLLYSEHNISNAQFYPLAIEMDPLWLFSCLTFSGLIIGVFSITIRFAEAYAILGAFTGAFFGWFSYGRIYRWADPGLRIPEFTSADEVKKHRRSVQYIIVFFGVLWGYLRIAAVGFILTIICIGTSAMVLLFLYLTAIKNEILDSGMDIISDGIKQSFSSTIPIPLLDSSLISSAHYVTLISFFTFLVAGIFLVSSLGVLTFIIDFFKDMYERIDEIYSQGS